MFDWRWFRNHTTTAGPCCREPGENGAARCGLKRPVAALLAAAFALAVLACSDDRRDTTPGSPDTIADRLRANADAFAYTIGRPGGTLTVATVSDPLTLNLAIATDSASVGVLQYLFEGLTETSWLTDEVEPVLAESWTRSDDGLTWTFRLRPDVRWHDGAPFTAHDVAFTFNDIIYNPDIEANARAAFDFRFLDEETGAWATEAMTVTALDDHTVRCALPVPFAPFLRSMSTPIYPRHILAPHVEDGTFADVWGIDTDPAEVIGTGPFTIERYDPEERVVLRRNPDYWLADAAGNPLPYLDEIVRVIMPDLESALASFKAGESDVHRVPGEQFAELEALQAEGNFTHHPQAGSRLRLGVPDLQPESGHRSARQAVVVRADPVSPGRGAQH